ncbi:MAG: NAD-dependent epimerase/dehydratase family protein [Armatimonadetes bacterium]|nr:NAD-dependent epimerase/dehydratase family protein [Armatimonadota bacterium]
MASRVLITGGAGFIGSHIAEHYARAGADVVVLDVAASAPNLAGIPHRYVQGSVLDADLVARAAEGADYVFHLAAIVSVPRSMESPWECVEINVKGTLAVLEAARAHAVRKVVLSSSAAVYGDDAATPQQEGMRPAPCSPYGISKLDGELYLELYRREHGVGTVSLRYFNVFGPRQDPTSQYAAVVPHFIHRALRDEDLLVHGDGEQTRDFIHVRDVVAANVLAAGAADMHGAYNVARGEKTTVNDLAQTIVEVVGSRSQVRHTPARPGDIRHSVADVSRIAGCGFEAAVGLADGLRETIDFFAFSSDAFQRIADRRGY